jgi:quercetin dioxygenase-like cupin family protein
MTKTAPALILFALLAASNAYAQAEPAQATEVLPGDVKWTNTPTPGVQLGVVYGNLLQPGLYVVRMKMAADSKVLPHTHPDTRYVTVLSGNMYFGLGDTFDPDKMKAYPPGSLITVPANTPHYVWMKDGEGIIQDVGIGPTATNRLARK